MKRILLPLLILTLMPLTAFAQEQQGVQLDIGGYFRGYGAYINQDTNAGSEIRKIDIQRDTEIYLEGETTLENDLKVGAHLEFDVDRGDSFSVDESFVFFSGTWGRVNLGMEDGAAYLLQVAAPAVDKNYDGVRQDISPVNYAFAPVAAGGSYNFELEGLSYDQDVSSKGDKITYLTPVFSGFQFGASYTPEITDASRAFGNALDDQTDDQSDAIDVAVRYEGKFENVSTKLGAGYSTSTIEGVSTGTNDDRDAWNIGADFGIGAFSVGAAYAFDSGAQTTNGDFETVAVGVNYTINQYTLGASYLNQSDEGQGASRTVDTNRYTTGLVYDAGAGVSFRGLISHIDHDSETLNADTQATVVLLGTQINF